MREKRERLQFRNYLGDMHVDVVCMQETKLKEADTKVVLSVWVDIL